MVIFILKQTKIKSMNSQQFGKQFQNFQKGFKGPSLGGALLFGLGFLAFNSYYYGIRYLYF